MKKKKPDAHNQNNPIATLLALAASCGYSSSAHTFGWSFLPPAKLAVSSLRYGARSCNYGCNYGCNYSLVALLSPLITGVPVDRGPRDPEPRPPQEANVTSGSSDLSPLFEARGGGVINQLKLPDSSEMVPPDPL